MDSEQAQEKGQSPLVKGLQSTAAAGLIQICSTISGNGGYGFEGDCMSTELRHGAA